jgi:hypothetical protein
MSTFSFTFSPDATLSSSEQGQLASSYTEALKAFLQSDAGADYVAFLAHTVNGLEVDAALALVDAIQAGEFSLDGLFGAAQSKTGEIDDVAGSPAPTMTICDVVIDLTAMLSGESTYNWSTVTKKDTIYHAREFLADGGAPEGWTDGWADATPEPILVTVNESFTFIKGTTGSTWNLELESDDPLNFTVNVTGEGDYQFNTEGFTITGDLTASWTGSLTSGGNPEGTANFISVDPLNETLTAGGLTDGSFDITASFTSPTGAGSEITVDVSYQYWA